MTLHFAGSWQAWTLYIAGCAGVMAACVMLALAFADLRTRFEATLQDDSDEGADWGKETPFHREGR